MFSLIFQTVTIDQTLSMGAEEDYKDACWLACVFDFPSLYLVVVVVWALHLMISNTDNDLQKILMRLTVSLAEPLPIQMPLYSTTICNVSLRIMSIWSKPRTDNLPQCGVPRRPSVTHKLRTVHVQRALDMTQWSRVSDLCRHVVDSDAGCQLPKELRRRAGAVLDAVRSVSVCNSRQIALHRLTPANHVLLLLSFPAFLDALRPLHVSHAITQKQSQYACLWTPCTVYLTTVRYFLVVCVCYDVTTLWPVL